jgi:hypothetical protein
MDEELEFIIDSTKELMQNSILHLEKNITPLKSFLRR